MADGFYLRRSENVMAILFDERLRPIEKIVGVTILEGFLNSKSECAWMSMETIASKVGCHRETARRAATLLVRCGLLRRERRSGSTSVFSLSEPYAARDLQQRRWQPTAGRHEGVQPTSGRNLKRESDENLRRHEGGLRPISIPPFAVKKP